MIMPKRSNKPSWWTIECGDEVRYKGELSYVTHIGNNKGDETLVKITLAGQAKAKQVRIKELTW